MISALIILATLVVDLVTDIRRWYKGGNINHTRGMILRGIGFVPAAIINPWSAMLALTYWMIFDTGFSLGTKRGLFYLGDAKLDRLQKNNKWIWVGKYVTGIAAVVIYFFVI